MAFRLATAFVDIFAKTDKLDRQMQRTKKKASESIGALSGLLAGGFAAAAGGAAVGGVLALAAQAEQLEVSFTTMLGSGEAAKGFLTDLREFAAGTPMTLPGLAKNAKLLMAMGVETKNVIPDLRMLGDVSQGNEEIFDRVSLAYGKMATKGKASLEEVRQMQEAGFNPLNVIAEKTGETMQELEKRVSAGGVSFDEMRDAMQTATGPGGQFNQMMIKQSKTLTGVISTLKDNLQLAAAEIGMKLLPAAKAMANAAITLIQGFMKLNAETNGLVGVIGLATFSVLAFNLALRMADTSLMNLLRTAAGAALAALGPYGILIGVIAAIVAGAALMVRYFAYFGQITEAWQVAVVKVQVAFQILKETVMSLVNVAMAALKALFASFGVDIPGSIDAARQGFTDFIVGMIEGISNFILDVAVFFQTMAENTTLVFEMMKSAGWLFIYSVRDAFFNLPNVVGAVLKAIFNQWVTNVTAMGELLWNLITDPANAGQYVAEAFGKIAQQAAESGADIAGAIQEGVSDDAKAAAMDLANQQQQFNQQYATNRIAAQQRVDQAIEDSKKEEAKEVEQEEKKAKKEEEEEKKEKQGFVGLSELGRQIQESFLKDEEKADRQKSIGLQEQQNSIQQEMLQEQKRTNEKLSGSAPVAEKS